MGPALRPRHGFYLLYICHTYHHSSALATSLGCYPSFGSSLLCSSRRVELIAWIIAADRPEMKSCQSTSKLERKTVERNRRIHMKGLCFKLASLIPSHHLKEAFSQQDQLEQAAVYIKGLREKVEQLKAKRNTSMSLSLDGINRGISGGMMLGLRLPLVEVREIGNSLEVVLISGVTRNFLFCDVVGVLEEEGVEVVNASISVTGDKVFHIIHSQVVCTRVGFDTARVYQRLKELVH